jgi:hypothetical protein
MDRILAVMKTPTPAKITFAGENTYKIYIRGRKLQSLCVETHQADAAGDGSRKRVQDVHSRAQPLRQSVIAAARYVKFSNLVLKQRNDGASRVACLQLRGKRMCDKVFLSLILVRFQSSIENRLKA